VETFIRPRRSPSSSPEESDEEEEDEDFEEFEDDDSYEARPRAPKRPRRAPASPAQRATSQHSPAGGELGGERSGVNWFPHADASIPTDGSIPIQRCTLTSVWSSSVEHGSRESISRSFLTSCVCCELCHETSLECPCRPAAPRQPSSLGPHRQQPAAAPQLQPLPPPQQQPPQAPSPISSPSKAAISAFEAALRQVGHNDFASLSVTSSAVCFQEFMLSIAEAVTDHDNSAPDSSSQLGPLFRPLTLVRIPAKPQRHTGGATLANGTGGGELFTPQSAASAAAAAASDRPRREIRPPPRLHAQFLDEHQVRDTPLHQALHCLHTPHSSARIN
jgi:hypothetical protein